MHEVCGLQEAVEMEGGHAVCEEGADPIAQGRGKTEQV
jgi:hypothetical protein